jgi:hypothetical protein
LHSGHFGNFAPNPAQRLAALLASMKDDGDKAANIVPSDATAEIDLRTTRDAVRHPEGL